MASDDSVDKGPGRPINTFMDRKALLLALDCVDEVVESHEASVVPIIVKLEPDIYAKGSDYANSTDPTLLAVVEVVESYGGEFRVTTSELMSSSKIINASSERFGAELDWLRQIVSVDLVLTWLEKAGAQVFQVLGDPIVDVFWYVTQNQVSRKDGTITWSPYGHENNPGGGYVIGQHVGEVSLESVSWTEKVRIGPHASKAASNTRYIGPRGEKLFSVREAMSLQEQAYEELVRHFDDLTEDVLENWIVADFGHGLFHPQIVEMITEDAEWLALTVQANSTNLGFNNLSKWPRADYFVVDHEEIRLTTGDRTSTLSELLEFEIQRLGAKVGAVTKGHHGAIISDGQRFVEIPAFNPNPVDTVGAGDAFFSYSAPLARVQAPLEVIAFIGSVAAAVHVGRKGNTTVDISTFKKWVKSILA